MAATATAEKPRQQARKSKLETEKNATGLALLKEPRLPYHPGIQERFGLDITSWRTLTDGIFPSARTTEGVILALAYCKARKLDVFKRPVNVVSVWSTPLKRLVEGVWPAITEHRITAVRTGQYAGIDETVFGEEETKVFKFDGEEEQNDGTYKKVKREVTVQFPSWARVTVYKMVAGQRVPFVGPRVHWLSAYGRIRKTDIPNDMWQRRPSDQLEKCAEAAALRRAFPEELGGMLTAEEMEGQIVDITPGGGDPVPVEPPPPKPRREDFIKNEADEAKSAETAPPKADVPSLDQAQAYDVLIEELTVAQQAADVDEIVIYRKEVIDSLHKSQVPAWGQAVENKRAALSRKA